MPKTYDDLIKELSRDAEFVMEYARIDRIYKLKNKYIRNWSFRMNPKRNSRYVPTKRNRAIAKHRKANHV